MFGCVLENTIENTFSTCCSHFLTFFQLPNEYIISFISQNTNKTKKKIIKSGQTIGEIAIGVVGASHEASITIGAFARCVDRAKIEAEIMIGATVPTSDVTINSFSLPSLSLSLSTFQGWKYFEVKIEMENHFRCFGSQIRSARNAFQFDRI